MKQLEIKKMAKDIWQKILPIKGVLYFMIILLVCHFLWKISFLGDAETRDASVTFWGIDISRLFTFWVNKLSDSVYFQITCYLIVFTFSYAMCSILLFFG